MSARFGSNTVVETCTVGKCLFRLEVMQVMTTSLLPLLLGDDLCKTTSVRERVLSAVMNLMVFTNDEKGILIGVERLREQMRRYEIFRT
jgi:hypothetical protein